MLNYPWRRAVFSVVDLEMTHHVPQFARMCEIAVVPIVGGVVDMKRAYVAPVDPQTDFKKGSSEVNGLSMSHLRGLPTAFDRKREIAAALRGVLIAHCAYSDVSILRRFLPRSRFPLILDTQLWARKRKEKEEGLGALVKRYDLHERIVSHPQGRELEPHRAYYDAAATALLFIEFVRQLQEALERDLTVSDIATECAYDTAH